jgi:hypothetical protein
MTIADAPQVMSQTDAFERLPRFADTSDIALDPVPGMPDPFSPEVDAEINESTDMNTLMYDMLDSGVVPRVPTSENSLPITQRLRAQAQRRSKSADDDSQNVGPVQ